MDIQEKVSEHFVSVGDGEKCDRCWGMERYFIKGRSISLKFACIGVRDYEITIKSIFG